MITDEKALGQQHRHSPGAPPQLLTVKQFALAYPAFTEAAMRNLIFKANDRRRAAARLPATACSSSAPSSALAAAS